MGPSQTSARRRPPPPTPFARRRSSFRQSADGTQSRRRTGQTSCASCGGRTGPGPEKVPDGAAHAYLLEPPPPGVHVSATQSHRHVDEFHLNYFYSLKQNKLLTGRNRKHFCSRLDIKVTQVTDYSNPLLLYKRSPRCRGRSASRNHGDQTPRDTAAGA